MSTPTFGAIEDDTELGLDDVRLPFNIIGYSAVPDPVTGEREPITAEFHAIPSLRSEKIIAMFGRSRNGKVQVESIAKAVMSMIAPEERDAFLDFIEDPNLAFSGAMFEGVMDWLVEEAGKGDSDRPKGSPSVSSRGRASVGRTSTAKHSSGRALPSGRSR